MKVQTDHRNGLWPEPETRRQFERDLSAGPRREWDSLADESDPDMLAATALRLAARWEGTGQRSKSAFLLAGLLQNPASAPELRRKVEARWAALQGGGDFGGRFESLLSHFVTETKTPWPLLAMSGAAVGFHFSRLALLGKLRGAAAKLAPPLATAGEAAVFTAALPATERGPGADFLSALLLMSSVRLSAWPQRFVPPTLRFPSIYGGVLFAQGVERKLGLLPAADTGAALVEGLALSLHLQAGAGLARAALGPSGFRTLAEAEMRQATLRPTPPRFGAPPWVPAPTFSGTTTASSSRGSLPAHVYAMSENGSGRPRPPLRLVSSDPLEEFTQTFGSNPAFQEAYHRILNAYGARHEGKKLHDLLFDSGIRHPAVMNPGLGRLAEALENHRFGESGVSYRDWLVKKIYERVYFENRSPQALGKALRSLAVNENAAALEQSLVPYFTELDLRASRPIATLPHSMKFQMEAAKRLHEWRQFERETDGLPLTDAARQVIFRWKQAQADRYLGNMNTKIEALFDDLDRLGRGPQAVRTVEVNAAIESAGESPLGVARLSRLESLLRFNRSMPLDSRLLAELAE